MRNRFSGPTLTHWLGTDNFGRDLWSRLIFGARISLTIACISVAMSLRSSVRRSGLRPAISAAGSDLILMRITDIFLGFPAIVLALAIVAVLGPGMVNVGACHYRRRLDGICPRGARHDADAARAELRAGRQGARRQSGPHSLQAKSYRMRWDRSSCSPRLASAPRSSRSRRSASSVSACRRRHRPGAGRFPTAPASCATNRGCRSLPAPRSWSPCSASICSVMACATSLDPRHLARSAGKKK